MRASASKTSQSFSESLRDFLALVIRHFLLQERLRERIALHALESSALSAPPIAYSGWGSDGITPHLRKIRALILQRFGGQGVVKNFVFLYLGFKVRVWRFRAPCGIGGFNRDPFPSPAAGLEGQLGKGLRRAGAGLEDLGFRVGDFRVVRFRV
jgi:hypothetical protein